MLLLFVYTQETNTLHQANHIEILKLSDELTFDGLKCMKSKVYAAYSIELAINTFFMINNNNT